MLRGWTDSHCFGRIEAGHGEYGSIQEGWIGEKANSGRGIEEGVEKGEASLRPFQPPRRKKVEERRCHGRATETRLKECCLVVITLRGINGFKLCQSTF